MNDDTAEPLLLNYDQAAAKLGVSLSQLYVLMRAKEIVPLKLGPQVRRILPSDLDEFVKRKKKEQQGEGAAA